MKLYIIYNFGKLPAEFLGQEYDSDFFIGDSFLQSIFFFFNVLEYTESRLADFKKAVQRDVKDRARTCREEIGFVLARQADCSILMEQIRNYAEDISLTESDFLGSLQV